MLPFLFSVSLFSPLLSGLSAFIARSKWWGNVVAQSIAISGGVIGIIATVLYYISGVEHVLILPGGLGALFGITHFSAFFLGLINLGVVVTSVYAIGYLSRYRDLYAVPIVNVMSALFIFGMSACVMSLTVFSFLLFWEVMSVAVYFLVIADRTETSLKAGLLYFMMTHLGFVSILAGLMILTDGNPFMYFLDVPHVAKSLSDTMRGVAFLLLFIGFGSKAGLIPFHRWLPAAHPQAPSGSSALMSGVMIKIAVFGFLQALLLFPIIPFWYSAVVLSVGLISAFFGALYACVESDVKRLLAWSSIENMGLIFSGIGALAISMALPNHEIVAPALMFFVIMHMLSHSIFKMGLFMGAGAIISEVHTRDMDEMGGLARHWPSFSFAFLALSLTAAALPPFAAFYGEWAYLQSLAVATLTLDPFFAFGAAFVISVIALVSGLALFAFVKMFSAIFLGRGRSNHMSHVQAMPFFLSLPVFICVALSLLISLFAPTIASFIGTGSATLVLTQLTVGTGASIDPRMIFILFGGVSIVMLIMRWFMYTSRVRMTGTWDCGQPLTERMEYTATGFSAPIRFFFRGLVVTEKNLIVTPISTGNPWIVERTLVWDVRSFWERWLYIPIGKGVFVLARQVRRIQNGSIQFYLLLVFVALIGTIIVSLWR